MDNNIIILLSIGIIFIIAGIVLKIYLETGRMVLLEHLKEDWTFRLPARLSSNKYRGLSRICYPFWAVCYYCLKAIIILELCLPYYILFGIYAATKGIKNRQEVE